MKTYHQQAIGIRFLRSIFGVSIMSLVLMLSAGLAVAVNLDAQVEHNQYDARIAFNQGLRQTISQPQEAVVSKMAREIPDMALTIDNASGAVRSLSSHTGYLSEPKTGQDVLPVVRDFLNSNAALLGMNSKDLSSLEVTNRVYSKVAGTTHVYMRQVHEGLPVYNSQMQANLDRRQKILSVNNNAETDLAVAANSKNPAIDLSAAVVKAAQHLGIALPNQPKIISAASGVQHITSVHHGGISLEPIQGKLMWLPIRKRMMRLVWNFQIHTLDQEHVYDFTIDAVSGKVWTRFDWVASDQYRVYASPAESPNHVTTKPPADGRTLVTNPANTTASPFSWHDTDGIVGAEYSTTRGNNVFAYADADANNSPDTGSDPYGGPELSFDFPINHNSAPSFYQNAAVANLFYWNNIIHDVQYQYGFDEAAGNFQTNNYGKGGLGGDAVKAEAQDGSGTSNANFMTPRDGAAPRMQMFLWDRTYPERDGDIDNGIIIHEYGHGISNRLVGGPSNVSCLTNNQQPGEGLSDWWSLVYTAKVGDKGTDRRGIGTYVRGQPVSGVGIRTQPYSTDPVVNTWTYESINGMAIPHGVGSVWAQAAWEVYWALVDHWGFDPNLYNAMGNAGNQRMMLYVNEGLKNTACNPTFTQVRDGIIDAAKVLHGGEDVCRLWTAFAAFGLGTDAISGGPNSTSPTNGFSVPAACEINSVPSAFITSPANGATVAGNITVTASANTTGTAQISKVEFFVDNVLKSTDTSSSYSMSLNTTTLSNGTHTLVAKAYDTVGNMGASTPVTFSVNNLEVDQEPPAISVSESGTGGTITFSATATDNISVTKVEFYVDEVLKGADLTSPYSLNVDSTTLNNGSHTLVGKAYDATGNMGTSESVIFSVNNSTIDTVPVISVTETGGSGTISLNATASDDVGVTKVEFYVDGDLKGTDQTSPYFMSLDSTTLSNGSHTLVGKAYDAAGNIGTSPNVLFEINNPVDTTTYKEVENNGNTSAANVISDDATKIVAYIGASGDQDYFRINVAAGRTVNVNMTGPARDYDLYLLSRFGSPITYSTTSGSKELVTLKNTDTKTAIYYIKVIGYGGAYSPTTPYNLVLSR